MAKKKKYPCHKLPKSQWCDRNGPGGFMGHTCIKQKIKRSEKSHRPIITRKENNGTIEMVQTALLMRLEEKGYGAWVSRHEILGMLTEEYIEVTDAVHDGTLLDVRRELIDIAVGCIFGISCIDARALDW